MLAWLLSLILVLTAITALIVGTVAERAYPHGPLIPTGDYDCANDGRGPCFEVVNEDLEPIRNSVPEWVILARKNNFVGFGLFGGIIGLVFIYVTTPELRRQWAEWRANRHGDITSRS